MLRSLQVRRSLAGAAAVLLACAVALVGVGPADASVTGQPSVEAQLLSLTNSARASAGLPALHTSSTLTSIARSWSAHQASTNVLAHNPSLFSSVHGWSGMAENVAKAYSASQAQSLFMGSSGHRTNILNRNYSLVGIGVSRDSSGALWFTVDFEQPSGAVVTPAPKPKPKPVVKPKPSNSPSVSSRTTIATRPNRSTTRSVVPTVVAKPTVSASASGSPGGQLTRLRGSEANVTTYEAAPVVAVADLSATPNPIAATTALVGFIGSMVLAAAGLLLLGARTRRRS